MLNSQAPHSAPTSRQHNHDDAKHRHDSHGHGHNYDHSYNHRDKQERGPNAPLGQKGKASYRPERKLASERPAASERVQHIFGPNAPQGEPNYESTLQGSRPTQAAGSRPSPYSRSPRYAHERERDDMDNPRYHERRSADEYRGSGERRFEGRNGSGGHGSSGGGGGGSGAHKALHIVTGAASRAAAAQIMEAVQSGMSLTEAFPLYEEGLDQRDQAFVHEIVYGSLRQRRLLMHTLQPMFEHKLTERHRIVQNLLLTALYQLVFMRIPAHGVVSATVSACGACGRKAFAPLVNAILRRFLRAGAELSHSDQPMVEYSFPDWLGTQLQEAYGEQYIAIMQQSNIKAPLFLRVENSKIATADYLKQLQEHEIAASPCAFSPCAIKLEVPTNVTSIPGFNEGLCTVQDLSAQLAVPLLQLNKGQKQRVLDCCCAPGGKTAHILDFNPEAQVVALDVDASRLRQTRTTLERLGRLPRGKHDHEQAHKAAVTLAEGDAQNLSTLEGQFDRILVDAPCSGTGVIRRHPDIKWLRRAKDIPNLVQTQAQILDAAYDKLAPDGILLYTTCSILPAENSEQIKAFLERHPQAHLLPFTIGEQEYTTYQRLPGDDEGDGFFYARIHKPLAS